MPVILGAKAQAGFDQPLELMKDCHRRIEHFLDVLLQVASGDCHLDDQRRRALDTALTYFREAAPRHTADEEESLFPRLRQGAGDKAQFALQKLASLEADHLRAAKLHDLANDVIEQWIRQGELPEMRRRELVHHLQALRDLYRAHIDLEEQVLFPMAASALPERELSAIGSEMKLRRKTSTAPTASTSQPSAHPKGMS